MITTTLPLTDLHRHLDGNIRIETILELGLRYALPLPADNIEGLRPHVQIVETEPDLLGFLAKLDWGVAVLGDLDACRRVAYENVQDVKNAKIDYAELRFSPYYMALKHNLPIAGVVEAVVDGVQSGCRDFSVNANLIGILSRTFGQQACQQELDALLTQQNNLVAIDLAGDELGKPGSLFVEHFNKVRNAHLQVTVHAGEAAGAASIWQAINELGATRIGHGVKAIEDPRLMDYLAKHQIGIESCLTSNIQTSTVSDFESHPIKSFLEHNVMACLNTDDPSVEGIELAHEYQVAKNEVGLTQAQICQSQMNGMELAFLSPSEKKALRETAVNR